MNCHILVVLTYKASNNTDTSVNTQRHGLHERAQLDQLTPPPAMSDTFHYLSEALCNCPS